MNNTIYAVDGGFDNRQHYKGNKLNIGDTVLVCINKEYGTLAECIIIGETKTQWKLKSILDKWVGEGKREHNFGKSPSRILKIA